MPIVWKFIEIDAATIVEQDHPKKPKAQNQFMLQEIEEIFDRAVKKYWRSNYSFGIREDWYRTSGDNCA